MSRPSASPADPAPPGLANTPACRRAADGTPGSLVDDNGRFYKPLQVCGAAGRARSGANTPSPPTRLLHLAAPQAGPRAERELAFYAEMEAIRCAAEQGGGAGDDALAQLAAFVPRSCERPRRRCAARLALCCAGARGCSQRPARVAPALQTAPGPGTRESRCW